jgi:hypothetical protein
MASRSKLDIWFALICVGENKAQVVPPSDINYIELDMSHLMTRCHSFLGCVWQDSGSGCAGRADSVRELNPFYENVWQNSFSWLREVDGNVNCP